MPKITWLACWALFFTTSIFAQDLPKLGDKSDGSRSLPVHRIKLFDENGDVVKPYHQRRLPFSTKESCGGECHSYKTIAGGWHFESGFDSNDQGRPGQPWILVDQFSATQIPLSYRKWQGTMHPDSAGISPFDFVKTFGGFYPGGVLGEVDSLHSLQNLARWDVSGQQQINCLACHEINRGYDSAEYVAQIKKENFRWAPTAASGIGQVEGSAAKMPDHFDLYGNFDAPSPNSPVPMVFYENSPFNRKGEVLFEIERKVPNEKCYACHSTAIVGAENERWHADEDVHLSAGMNCVDCHRNGLDHKMNRGYADEKMGVASLTCAGCHLGEGESALAGRMGAPKPEHAGMPLVHFDKLSCTACHSGPSPQPELANIKTSISHRLGTRGVNKSAQAVPHLQAPVFLPGHDGKIAPHKMIWPAFWASLNDEKITVIQTEIVRKIILETTTYRDTLSTGEWPQFSDSLLIVVLNKLVEEDSTLGKTGYFSGGKLFTAENDSQLVAEQHPMAAPYSWPLVHDVRPAQQSLGSNGCSDCHSLNSPIYFANISPLSPVTSAQGEKISMTRFRGASDFAAKFFAFTFIFRPFLKFLVLAASFLIGAIILIYLFKGLASFTKNISDEKTNL